MINNIQIYQSDDGQIQLNVSLKQENVWLSLEQITALFGRDKSVISRHINNVFTEGELERHSVVAKNATTCLSFNSQVLKMFFICLDIVDLSFQNNSAI